MENATTLLYALDGLRVDCVQLADDGAREVTVVGVHDTQGCPACGVLSGSVHARKRRRIKDLRHGVLGLRLFWVQRRWACKEALCARKTFAETCSQIGRRRRLTLRLREELVRSVTASTRAASDVAREAGVSWWSVNAALVERAAALTGLAPAGTRWLGVDETRARSVRWLLEAAEDAGAQPKWSRSNPWMTSFVDLDPARPAGILGLAPGRSGTSVTGWLDLQSQEFRDGITVVAVDPSAPFAAALRKALPQAELVVDHWHLDKLANLMVTGVRQRVTQQALGHRGRKQDDGWAYRRLLLRGARHLSDKQWTRLKRLLAGEDGADPTGQIAAAWAVKEALRQLLDAMPATRGPLVVDRRRDARQLTGADLARLRPYELRPRLQRFYAAVAAADLPEATRLATTIQTWWPAVEAFLRLRVTNARTEGYNRQIKQIKRVACGFRNQDNYQRRIMLSSAATAA